MRVSDEFKQERHHYGNASEFLKWEVVMRHGLATHLSAFPVTVAAGDVAMANGAADSHHRGRLPARGLGGYHGYFAATFK